MTKRKSETKERILEVAENLFAQLGYEGTSTRYLAQEAGVNMAMLNYYFGSKDGLLQAVLNRRINGLGQSLLEVKEQDLSSWEKLSRSVNIYLDRVLGNNFYHRIINRELSLMQQSEAVEVITENIMKNIVTIQDIIHEGIQNGSFRKLDVEMIISSIIGLNFYINNSSLISSRLLQVDTNNAEVLEQVVKPRMKSFILDYLEFYLLKK